MARRRKPEAKENHERWLVSYADFITLLFAFFVVMFANSQVDKEKVAKVSQSVKGALENGSMNAPLAGFLGRSTDVRLSQRGLANAPGGLPGDQKSTVAELVPSVERLSKDLEQEIKDGKIHVEMTPRGLVVSMREAAFFAAADDRVSPSSYEMLEKVAAMMRQLPNSIRMEGHTDATPIATARFRSNWELSAARSIAMMEVFTQRFGIPRAKVAIAGYADTAPVDSNDSLEGRARNRRVDIVILNQTGLISEPSKVAKPVPAH